MILANGDILSSDRQNEVLKKLPKWLNHTLSGSRLDPYCVIKACDRLSKHIEEGKYASIIASLEIDDQLLQEQLQMVINLLKEESLLAKVEIELGPNPAEPQSILPPFSSAATIKQLMPLGVLFHIAAGNVDGLPACSVVEGLLAGNINILKLPQADGNLSITLLSELISLEPKLKDYIYVFDTPSTDLLAMKQMAELADGIVVWGGDAAITAVRNMSPAGTKLIEWGHKLGFAYITPKGLCEEELTLLAQHLFKTKQVLCSSCQTIFIDTPDLNVLYDFCERFIPIMEKAAQQYPISHLGATAETTLQVYNAQLEAIFGDQRIFTGEHCSLIAKTDSTLELSFMFGNCIVKRLPHDQLISVLRENKGYLQTAGLICSPEEHPELVELLLRAGIVRVRSAGEMSSMTCCDAHDGEYPLQRYSRVVEF